MKSVTVDRQNGRQIDIEFRVEYQYIQTQQSEKHLDQLIRFLIKQSDEAAQPREESHDRSTLLPSQQ